MTPGIHAHSAAIGDRRRFVDGRSSIPVRSSFRVPSHLDQLISTTSNNRHVGRAISAAADRVISVSSERHSNHTRPLGSPPPQSLDYHRVLLTHSAQKDRTQPYLTLLQALLDDDASNTLIVDLVTFGHYFTQSTSMTSILGRAVLNAYVVTLCAGSGYQPALVTEQSEDLRQQWETAGKKLFAGDEGEERRAKVVEGVLEGGGGGWCDEQVS